MKNDSKECELHQTVFAGSSEPPSAGLQKKSLTLVEIGR